MMKSQQHDALLSVRPLHVPDVQVSVFILGAGPRIPTIHKLQFPARREGSHDDFQGSLSPQVPGCEERAGPGAVDGKTCTAGKELPLQGPISAERKETESLLSPAGSSPHERYAPSAPLCSGHVDRVPSPSGCT
jgi:hypothetical protein